MIKFKKSKKNLINEINDKCISLRDHLSIIDQQIKDLHIHQKEMVSVFNQH